MGIKLHHSSTKNFDQSDFSFKKKLTNRNLQVCIFPFTLPARWNYTWITVVDGSFHHLHIDSVFSWFVGGLLFQISSLSLRLPLVYLGINHRKQHAVLYVCLSLSTRDYHETISNTDTGDSYVRPAFVTAPLWLCHILSIFTRPKYPCSRRQVAPGELLIASWAPMCRCQTHRHCRNKIKKWDLHPVKPSRYLLDSTVRGLPYPCAVTFAAVVVWYYCKWHKQRASSKWVNEIDSSFARISAHGWRHAWRLSNRERRAMPDNENIEHCTPRVKVREGQWTLRRLEHDNDSTTILGAILKPVRIDS